MKYKNAGYHLNLEIKAINSTNSIENLQALRGAKFTI